MSSLYEEQHPVLNVLLKVLVSILLWEYQKLATNSIPPQRSQKNNHIILHISNEVLKGMDLSYLKRIWKRVFRCTEHITMNTRKRMWVILWLITILPFIILSPLSSLLSPLSFIISHSSFLSPLSSLIHHFSFIIHHFSLFTYSKTSTEHITKQFSRHGQVHHNLRHRLIFSSNFCDKLTSIQIVSFYSLF